MKITTTTKTLKELPPTFIRIAFDEEKSSTRLIEKDGHTFLLISNEPKESPTKRTLRSMIRSAIRTAKSLKIERLALDAEELFSLDSGKVFSRNELLRELAENALIAQYEFTRYKTQSKKEYMKELVIAHIHKGDEGALEAGITVGTYVNHARDLSNTPGGDMTPQVLATAAKNLAKGSKTSVTILAKKEIEKLKMGALLGVSKGSTEDPRFIILEYWGAGKPKAGGSKKNIDKDSPIVFIGKGITFDTGGLNLKPSDAVLDMHLDMSGGGAVIAAIIAAAHLGLKKNIIGLIPSAENMVSGESFRPGDVLTTMSGKTVDVLNTDAEGRLVLADALTYARRYNPRLVIDVATLTGAALVALGQHASAIMTTDTSLQETLMELGEESGDYVWPLPLWNEYKQHTKGIHGDIANIPASGARYGGAINGGMFLTHFSEGLRWAHIDMAPRMVAAPGDNLSKGSTGEPVRLLIKIAETE